MLLPHVLLWRRCCAVPRTPHSQQFYLRDSLFYTSVLHVSSSFFLYFSDLSYLTLRWLGWCRIHIRFVQELWIIISPDSKHVWKNDRCLDPYLPANLARCSCETLPWYIFIFCLKLEAEFDFNVPDWHSGKQSTEIYRSWAWYVKDSELNEGESKWIRMATSTLIHLLCVWILKLRIFRPTQILAQTFQN